jgi:hypothetical protein
MAGIFGRHAPCQLEKYKHTKVETYYKLSTMSTKSINLGNLAEPAY